MCQALEDMRKKAEDAGKEETAQDVARSLVVLGFDTEKIAQIVKFAPETVQKWLDAEA